jgi:hypothetical protein
VAVPNVRDSRFVTVLNWRYAGEIAEDHPMALEMSLNTLGKNRTGRSTSRTMLG